MRARASRFAASIEEAGASLNICVGLIDGAARFISRLGGRLHRACYSGHKRKHALRFRNVLTPDGLFFVLYGPVEGRRYDMTLYFDSGLDATLQDQLSIDGER